MCVQCTHAHWGDKGRAMEGSAVVKREEGRERENEEKDRKRVSRDLKTPREIKSETRNNKRKKQERETKMERDRNSDRDKK